jgi:hypothetical protein
MHTLAERLNPILLLLKEDDSSPSSDVGLDPKSNRVAKLLVNYSAK